MKSRIKIILAFFALVTCIAACKKEDSAAPPVPKVVPPVTTKVSFTETKVPLANHVLTSFSIINNTKYLVVFESGLGDSHLVWNDTDVALQINNAMDVLLYDRAGIGNSENGPTPRDISRLQGELDTIINSFSNGRKVILVGHSLGGLIIRDCAIKNPTRIAGLLFVDPSHESYSHPTQADEDAMYNSINSSTYGSNFGPALEAREWIEDLQYMTTLPNLPDVPVVVLTSMMVDNGSRTAADRQTWYNAHESLKTGVTDFTHVGVPNSGHYIMIDQPKIVIDNLNTLISKLP